METTTDSTVATTGWINNDKTLKVDDLFWPVIWFSRLAFFGDFDWPPFWIWWTKSATRARTGWCIDVRFTSYSSVVNFILKKKTLNLIWTIFKEKSGVERQKEGPSVCRLSILLVCCCFCPPFSHVQTTISGVWCPRDVSTCPRQPAYFVSVACSFWKRTRKHCKQKQHGVKPI